MEILKTITIDGLNFYFQFRFDRLNHSLTYFYNRSHGPDVFRICYNDNREEWISGLHQIRTYI